jgi:catechol 2,3-dioxygenase-like lactoylglutathione lyase family enzyme
MIFGAHVVVYSNDAEADRVFFRDVLGFKAVDAGHGWLIFALPPAEAAFHPSDNHGSQELYFMCKALKAEIAALAKKGVKCSEVQEARWGSIARCGFPVEAKSAFINRSIPPRWASARNDMCYENVSP